MLSVLLDLTDDEGGRRVDVNDDDDYKEYHFSHQQMPTFAQIDAGCRLKIEEKKT